MDQKEPLVNIKNDENTQLQKKRPSSRSFYVELPLLQICPVIEDTEPWIAETDVEKPFCCGKTISTYPMLAGGKTREGEPIADRFLIKTYKNCVLLAVADGCSWGLRSLNAASSAILAFNTYLSKRLRDIKDTHDAGHYMLRAFSEGHNKIVEGKPDIWDAGTTTLIGCMLLELAEDWAALVVNVGDCRAFHYSKQNDQVIEITAGNRLDISDRRDPGGRLGPYLKGGTPDLRNLYLYFTRCQPGDLIVLLSDGVHDNLDPEQLGLEPYTLGQGLTAKTWSELNREVAEETKTTFREEFILKLIKQGHNTPVKLTNALLQHCITITKPSREYMETHPTCTHPENLKEFPGKMDHSTCVVYEVPPKVSSGTKATTASHTTLTTAPSNQNVTSQTLSQQKLELQSTSKASVQSTSNQNTVPYKKEDYITVTSEDKNSRANIFETTWTTTTVSSKTVITTTVTSPSLTTASPSNTNPNPNTTSNRT